MGVYGLATFLVLVVSFNLPFLMEEYHFTSGNSGIMISLFFLAIMTPGFFLNRIVGTLKEKTKFYSFLSIGIGLALSFSYIMLQTISATFAIQDNFPPMLAAWMPNFLFAFVAYFCYRNAPR